MICTTQQLVSMRNQWLQQARQDLRNQIINFMEQNRTNEHELANVLALNVDSVRAMLNGTRDITLNEFATLLIATDNVLEIKPVSQSPLAHGRMPQQPPRGQRNAPKRDSNGRFAKRGGAMPPMPPMGGGYPMPPMGGMPMGAPAEEDLFGGMPLVGKENTDEAQPTSTEFDNMTRPQMIDMICGNGWDQEIDIARATRSQLISFLESKKETPAEETADSDGSIDAIAKGLADLAKSNPAMMDALKGLLGK